MYMAINEARAEFLKSKMLRRLQSTLASLSSPAQTTTNSSAAPLALDLDFVLRLLGNKSGDTSVQAVKGPELNISQWAKVKLTTIELPTQPQETTEKKSNAPLFTSTKKPAIKANFPAKEKEDSIMDRLQSLADSLPTRMSPVAPLSFFDPESVTKRTRAIEDESEKNFIRLPTIDYGDRDWSKVTLSSILDKLIPEDLKVKSKEAECAIEVKEEQPIASLSTTFAPLELRLLDYDQFVTLAHHLGIKCSNQTDLRIENEILNKFGESSGPLKKKRSVTKAKDGFTWTESMESLLLRLYDEIRSKKQAVDAKFAAFLEENKLVLMKDKRKTSERGLWAVLTDEFSVQAGWKVNFTEIKKKVHVLKCLQVKK